MADIVMRNQGYVSDEGQVNWRGDQVSVTPGDQSVLDTSTVQMCPLGMRKVVGDRVFRYAQAGATLAPGRLCQSALNLLVATAGTVNQSGGKIFTFYFAATQTANVYNDGYLMCQSGTATWQGTIYKVKTHGTTITATTNANLTLYEPLKYPTTVADTWALVSNPYALVTTQTAGNGGTAPSAGVCMVNATTNDYFWLQTWGPAGLKCGAGTAANMMLIPDATGQAIGMISTASAGIQSMPMIGFNLNILTASQYAFAFLTIAP